LKQGAYAILNDEDEENYDLDKILENAGKSNTSELYSLKKATFGVNNGNMPDLDDPLFWDKILKNENQSVSTLSSWFKNEKTKLIKDKQVLNNFIE